MLIQRRGHACRKNPKCITWQILQKNAYLGGKRGPGAHGAQHPFKQGERLGGRHAQAHQQVEHVFRMTRASGETVTSSYETQGTTSSGGGGGEIGNSASETGSGAAASDD